MQTAFAIFIGILGACLAGGAAECLRDIRNGYELAAGVVLLASMFALFALAWYVFTGAPIIIVGRAAS